MTRAAIYARYSSDLRSAASIEDQVRLCKERAAAEKIEIVEVYADYAISGGSLKNRTGMQKLIEDAGSGRFEFVIAEALDRLCRGQEDIAAIFKRLSYADVAIFTLAEGEISELHIGIKGTMNALFLKDLAQKTRRGQRGRVEAGKIPGSVSYGYRIVRRLLDDGAVATGEREIDTDQAKIVRRVFAECSAGHAPRRVAARLNAEGAPGPRGGLWNASTINGSRQRHNGILNNGRYLGRIIYNRQRFVKDPQTDKRTSRPNPESEWVVKDVPKLRIIDDGTWAAVHEIKARYAGQRGNLRQTKKQLLSGLVRCGACGGSMTIVNRETYSCSAKRERGTCDSPASVKAADLEERVLDGLQRILLGRDTLIETFADAYRAELDRLRRTRNGRLQANQRELAKVQRGIDRCVAFITKGEGSPGAVREQLASLEDRKRRLERDLKLDTATEPVAIHPNIAELYRRKATQLQSLLCDEATRTEAFDLIRSLVERIEVAAGTKRGQADVTLVGALASILEFALQPNKKAACGADGVGRVLMVAGAGYQRYLIGVSVARA